MLKARTFIYLLTPTGICAGNTLHNPLLSIGHQLILLYYLTKLQGLIL